MSAGDSAQLNGRRHFVVFHMGRCGSTVLESLLRETGEVAHGSEVFEQFYLRRKEERPELTPGKFLRRRKRKAAERGKIYGFEIKYLSGTHLERIGLTRAEAPGFFARIGFGGFVLLSRKNLLDRMISQIVAQHRGSYIREAGDTRDTGVVHVPVERVRMGRNEMSLIEAMTLLERETDDMRAILRNSVPDLLELTYEEDVLGDPNRGARRIAHHVGVEYADRAPAQEKIVTRNKTELVTNYDELEAALAGTRFAWMLRTEQKQETHHV